MNRRGRRYSVAQSALLTEKGRFITIGCDEECRAVVGAAADDHGVMCIHFGADVEHIALRYHGFILHAVINGDAISDLTGLLKLLMECGVFLISIEGNNRDASSAAKLHCARNYTIRDCPEFNETVMLAVINY